MTLSNKVKFTLSALAVATLAACGQTDQVSSQQYVPEVEVAKVIEQPLATVYSFNGQTQSPETIELRPRISGYVDTVLFSEGSNVKAGETLFIIDQAPFQAEVARLQAEKRVAISQLDLAQREFDRAEKLINSRAISKEILDSRSATLQQSTARLASVEAALELAELNLEYTEVKAPIDGKVSNAQITKGNFVQAGQSVLTTLVSTDKVFAYFDANQELFLQQAHNTENASKTPVLMSLSANDNFPYSGFIDFVDNQLNPLTGTIRARAVFENNDGRLIPGLFSRLQIIGSENTDTILVDDKAIGTDLNNKYVLTLSEDSTVEYRQVTLGKKVNGLRVITSGLTHRDIVVTNGLQRVRPGAQVNAVETNMTSEDTLTQLQADTQRAIELREFLATKATNDDDLLVQVNIR